MEKLPTELLLEIFHNILRKTEDKLFRTKQKNIYEYYENCKICNSIYKEEKYRAE